MALPAAQAALSSPQWNHEETALRAVRNRVRRDDHLWFILPNEVNLELPDRFLRPVPLFPEVDQHIEEKCDAHAIQYSENEYGHWTPFRRRRSTL